MTPRFHGSSSVGGCTQVLSLLLSQPNFVQARYGRLLERPGLAGTLRVLIRQPLACSRTSLRSTVFLSLSLTSNHAREGTLGVRRWRWK